jgi:hypothetical protein
MVSVDVTGAVVEIAAGWEAVHVGGSVAPAGLEVTAQVTATVPVKPPLGVIVTVEVALIPADVTVAVVPLSVKTAGDAIVRETVVVSETPPELPVTVTV